MTIQQLEYVVALDNFRHFVKAADHCYVTQPTLTMQIKKLEDEIGVTIFDRSVKPLKPTSSGEQVVMKARQILREVNQLRALVFSETELIDGEFKVGIIPTVSPYLLPLFLPSFVENNPATRLKITEMQTDEIIRDLHKGTLDIGILATPLGDKNLREIPLYNEPFLLYLPKNHELRKEKQLTPNLLNPQEMLLLEQGHCFRDQALNICNQNERIAQRGFEYESGSLEALKGLVKNGMGYTLVPQLSVTAADDCMTFSNPQPAREISLVTHHSFSREALIERLHKTIQSAIPENLNKGKKFTKVIWR